ncbi:MAG: hypothetical protein ABI388_00530, partial [Bacteroidia bacterium]
RKEVFEEEHIYNQPANLPEGKFIANNQPSRNNKQENSGKTTDGFAIAGFVLGFVPLQVGLIFAVLNAIGNITLGSGGLSAVSSLWFAIPLLFAFISFVLCLTAIIRISRNKETKKGLSMAVFGLILSLIAIMVLLALVVSA